MNETERKATLAHLMSFEERDDVAEHLRAAHIGRAVSDALDQTELDQLHVAEHKQEPVRP